MSNYQVPGVYVEEISTFPPAVAPVETALPAFIGYTAERRDGAGVDLAANQVQRIKSLPEFEARYGRGAPPSVDSVDLDETGGFLRATVTQQYYLYDALRLFYANGGGDCFIVSVGAGGFPGTPTQADISAGVAALATWDEPTILLAPDAVSTSPVGPNPHPSYQVAQDILAQCAELGDRVGVFDLPADDLDGAAFRDNTGTNGLSYGAAYTPWLNVALEKVLEAGDLGAVFNRPGVGTDQSLANVLTDIAGLPGDEAILRAQSSIYRNILRGLNGTPVAIPPSGAVAGVYAFVDENRGVWKAPANAGINGVLSANRIFTESELGDLNVHVDGGKSINAIRDFRGRGTLIFGARTLAGNSGDWRYISVRRLLNMIQESCQKAAVAFTFEPNDAGTWTQVRAMIENFLYLLWRDGALQGAKPEHAYRVAIGLGQTMSPQDVLDGRMIVEIALAPVRPAEFIVLRFMQHLPNS